MQVRKTGLDLDLLGRPLAARKKVLKAAFGQNSLSAPVSLTMKVPPLERSDAQMLAGPALKFA